MSCDRRYQDKTSFSVSSKWSSSPTLAATRPWPATVFATRPPSVGPWAAPPAAPAPAASVSAAPSRRAVEVGAPPTTPILPVTGQPPPAVSPSVKHPLMSASSGGAGGD